MNAYRCRGSADEAIILHISTANTRGAVVLLQQTQSILILTLSVGGRGKKDWSEPAPEVLTYKYI